MTTLNPPVAAGWFAGMVEAWKLGPTVTSKEARTSGQLRRDEEEQVLQ
jgi:pheromone shutdown protein TraB